MNLEQGLGLTDISRGRLGRRPGVLLSKACPTSLESDQTKGGVGRVYREHRGSVPESKRFDVTKIQLSPN